MYAYVYMFKLHAYDYDYDYAKNLALFGAKFGAQQG